MGLTPVGFPIPGVDGYHRRLAGAAKTGSVLYIRHGAAGEGHHPISLRDGNGEMLPVDQIPANGMPLTHVAPSVAEGVVLVEQIIFAIRVNETIGIVHPVLGGGVK
uniref:Uncharacterized protein n=1 Tax=Candidatus Kentrum eta TaxID=2126337 RepID=A0A450V5V1_9GAMM|nr:MAG: hypothetical protein BECKH772A_GA0070896_100443 [Candidatus Kentron sp. H]VFJ93361.1 MAG: hypothetical protein BECKH772B_GA0070898_100433 [Candidatus Kentron sp. H]VFK00174.1 MAG: hypothetical protein BECKH772C_GA0070978_100413 [Candidatus Kentron sp. H]